MMTDMKRRNSFRKLILAGFAPLIALSSLAVSIILPTVVIWGYALFNSKEQDIVNFASAVAEPVSLIGTLGLAILISCKRSKELSAFSWSLFTGLSSALGLFSAAFWTADLDMWAIFSVAFIPFATVFFWKLRTNKAI